LSKPWLAIFLVDSMRLSALSRTKPVASILPQCLSRKTFPFSLILNQNIKPRGVHFQKLFHRNTTHSNIL
jgi:hypothetical protein